MKFKTSKKGHIGFGIGDQNGYRATVGNLHTGVDWVIGYGKPVTFDNPGYIYKVFTPQELPSNWTCVYQLCEATPLVKALYPEADLMEVSYGHLSSVAVKPGEYVAEDQLVGHEGNFGEVYSGGIQITPAMQDAGDKRGSHVHEQWRPVKKVSKRTDGKHYLNNKDGTWAMRDGQMLEVLITSELAGCIDPLQFAESRLSQKIQIMAAGTGVAALFAFAQLLSSIGL